MLRLPSNLTWRFLGYTVTIEHHNLGTFGGLWKRVKYVAVYFREQRELWQAIRLVSVRCNVWNNCSCPFILQTLFYKGLEAISLGPILLFYDDMNMSNTFGFGDYSISIEFLFQWSTRISICSASSAKVHAGQQYGTEYLCKLIPKKIRW